MKKIGKTARPFRYDLNQIPYDCTVEVRNRFKGLDLIDRVPGELWLEVHDIVQETGIKTILMEKKCKKTKHKKQKHCCNKFNKDLKMVHIKKKKLTNKQTNTTNIQFSSVQSLSRVRLFATP